jgi:tetratricopeptide (TPR) repeat protein
VIRRSARFDEALSCFERALAIDPNHAGAGWNAGLVYLTRGDYARGWEGYERRFAVPSLQRDRGFAQPRWDGSPLNGRTLLVHSEQGFGDFLQAARYFPMIAQRRGEPRGRVIVEVLPELLDLCRNIEGIDELVAFGQPLPAFDVFIPVFSLPRAFGTRLDTIPADVPYLRAPPERIARFADRLRGAADKRIGLVWAGKSVPDPLRSVPPEALAPLARVASCSLVSLQVGESSAASLPADLREKLTDLGPELQSFADTAAAMSNLDLIVTIDTAAAHLAGALGRPTWTLVPFSPDWRWMTEREDCPWYPTMRLFRQTRRREWRDVIERVAGELNQFAAT